MFRMKRLWFVPNVVKICSIFHGPHIRHTVNSSCKYHAILQLITNTQQTTRETCYSEPSVGGLIDWAWFNGCINTRGYSTHSIHGFAPETIHNTHSYTTTALVQATVCSQPRSTYVSSHSLVSKHRTQHSTCQSPDWCKTPILLNQSLGVSVELNGPLGVSEWVDS